MFLGYGFGGSVGIIFGDAFVNSSRNSFFAYLSVFSGKSFEIYLMISLGVSLEILVIQLEAYSVTHLAIAIKILSLRLEMFFFFENTYRCHWGIM